MAKIGERRFIMENEENLQSVEGTEEMGLIQDFSAIGKTHTTKANIFT